MNTADEQVLADPGAYNVDEVTDAFTRATPEQIAAAQALEAAGKNRSTITGYAIPTVEDGEPRFARERILDLFEGPVIVGEIESLGRVASYPEIVGALHGNDSAAFTRAEVRGAVEAFLVKPEQGE